MSDKSAIEWTEATWNPVTGCSKVSPGCANCYAETLSLRFGWSPKPWTPENAAENVILHPERLDQPLRWRRPRMIFVNSMSDLFHEEVPFEYVLRVYGTIEQAPRHTFQVLTKRPERAREFYRWADALQLGLGPTPVLDNLWLGVSIENARFTWRADVLREIPAAVRFISAEPLLGSLFPADPLEGHPRRAEIIRALDDGLSAREAAQLFEIEPSTVRWHRKETRSAALDLTGIDWLIVGGESGGRDARPMHPQWARELRDACLAACGPCNGVGQYDGHVCQDERPAFFFKQWGSWSPTDERASAQIVALEPDGRSCLNTTVLASPDTAFMRCTGASQKSGGRLLDGWEWNEMPS